jgi:hypothetical protein
LQGHASIGIGIGIDDRVSTGLDGCSVDDLAAAMTRAPLSVAVVARRRPAPLRMLSPGTGHRDLATDLLGYAEIDEARPAEAASDTTNYRATDVADARRIAGEILAHLSAAMSPKARDAYDLLQRAWTLLLQIYFEVQKVGLCLLRHDPRQDEWFPSLFAAGRSGRPRKKKDEGEGRAAGGRSNGDAAKPDAG